MRCKGAPQALLHHQAWRCRRRDGRSHRAERIVFTMTPRLFGTRALFRRSPQREEQRSCSNPLRAQGRFSLLHFASVSQPRPEIRPLLPCSKAAPHSEASTRTGQDCGRLIQPQDLPPVTRSTTASAQGATRPEGVIPKVPEGILGCPGRIRSHRSARNQSGAERRRLHRRKQGEQGARSSGCRGMTSPR